MKITAVEAIPVRISRPQAFSSSLGIHQDTENGVVVIDTDEGITGVGEASSVWDRKGRGECDYINQLIAAHLVGRDPFRINELSGLMDGLLHRAWPAKAGVEMALYDIVGKALNTPVYNLVGGSMREKVQLSHSLSMGPAEQIGQQAVRLAEEGYGTLKLKIGRDPASDRANVEIVRRRVPDVILRVDANMGWSSPKEAVRRILELEEFDLEMVEQPLHSSDLEGLRFVRGHVGVPIMADESVWRPEDAIRCIKASAVDIFNVYVSEAAGLGPAARIFAIAEAARIPCIIGSMPEFGIGTAAQAHLAFAMDNLGFASDVNGFVYNSDDVVEKNLEIRDGFLLPPPGPGLGVSLDPDKLEKYRMRE